METSYARRALSSSGKSFEENLEYGKKGESIVGELLVREGNTVIPCATLPAEEYKGPRVFTPEGEMISPDFISIANGHAIWVEVKAKKHSSYHRISGTWNTKIEAKVLRTYTRVADITGCPLDIYFLHAESYDPESGRYDAPIGIYILHIYPGEKISYHHECGGQIYFNLADLEPKTSLEPFFAS
jgi:hypothetical protein